MKTFLMILHWVCLLLCGFMILWIVLGIVWDGIIEPLSPDFFTEPFVLTFLGGMAAVAAAFWFLARLLKRMASRY